MTSNRRHDAPYQPPPIGRWRVTATLDLYVAADTDRGALRLAQEAMRQEGRYVVERVETLRTDGIGAPIVELTWTPIECDLCQRKAWTLWHAPEGGLLVQCECGHTRGIRAEVRP